MNQPPTLQGYWADLPSPALADLPPDLVALLPLGATEQHGPHLPLAVDSLLTEAVADRALTHLSPDQRVLILPPLRITKSDEHAAFSGTLALSAETLLAVLRDIGAGLARSGVGRLLLFNGHGGNSALLEIAGRDLRARHGMVVAQASWFGLAELDRAFPPEETARDLHAGLIETAAMLSLRPDLVEMARAEDFTPAQARWAEEVEMIGLEGQPARPAWLAADLNPSGACGNAAAADGERGAQILESAARNLARLLAEMARFTP
jgi:creatinine amidohydrolase